MRKLGILLEREHEIDTKFYSVLQPDCVLNVLVQLHVHLYIPSLKAIYIYTFYEEIINPQMQTISVV